MITADQPLDNFAPLYRDSDGNILTQFEGPIAEKVGLLKMDFLGLTTLTLIDDALKMIKKRHGVDLILHGGDIGRPEILEELRAIAPIIAVRGNNDNERWASAFPETDVAKFDRVQIYILHDLKKIAVNPADRHFQVVISGHSHRPSIETRDDVLFLNPGSAGPRRFKLPVSVARLAIDGSSVDARIIELNLRK